MVDVVNVMLWRRDGLEVDGLNRVWPHLHRVWNESRSRFKINASHGCLLEHKTTGEVRYFHSSSNNATIAPRPVTIASLEELRDFCHTVIEFDLAEESLRRRPDTSWRLRAITNLTFYVYK